MEYLIRGVFWFFQEGKSIDVSGVMKQWSEYNIISTNTVSHDLRHLFICQPKELYMHIYCHQKQGQLTKPSELVRMHPLDTIWGVCNSQPKMLLVTATAEFEFKALSTCMKPMKKLTRLREYWKCAAYIRLSLSVSVLSWVHWLAFFKPSLPVQGNHITHPSWLVKHG